MVQDIDRSSVNTSSPFSYKARHRHQNQARIRPASVLLQLLAMVGIGLLLYPSASNWFATLSHGAAVQGYARQVDSLMTQERLSVFEQAHSYNKRIPEGVLRDPYVDNSLTDDLSHQDSYEEYLDMLKLDETTSIGEVNYPSLGISLPIYHGTGDEVISRGAGHLFGSSLPVGGESTHSVITSHSGLASAELFTPLLDAEVGEIFRISVLGVDNYYRVKNVEMVLPHQTSSLTVIDGEDWVTLLTCAPLGVNSHRYLVQGERIDVANDDDIRELAGEDETVGWPWWLMIFIGVSGISAYLIFSAPRSKVNNPDSSKRTGTRGIPSGSDLSVLKKAEDQ